MNFLPDMKLSNQWESKCREFSKPRQPLPEVQKGKELLTHMAHLYINNRIW